MIALHIGLEMNNSIWKTGFEQQPVHKVLIYLLSSLKKKKVLKISRLLQDCSNPFSFHISRVGPRTNSSSTQPLQGPVPEWGQSPAMGSLPGNLLIVLHCAKKPVFSHCGKAVFAEAPLEWSAPGDNVFSILWINKWEEIYILMYLFWFFFFFSLWRDLQNTSSDWFLSP